MGNRAKGLIVLGCVLLFAVLVYIVGPFLGCWYNEYRFNRYVHVKIDLPSCARSSEPCRYVFSFEAEKEPEAFQFEGAGLQHSYDRTKRTFSLSGVGSVINRNNVIEIDSSQVRIGNESLPRATQPMLIFVRRDGRLLSGYCDISW